MRRAIACEAATHAAIACLRCVPFRDRLSAACAAGAGGRNCVGRRACAAAAPCACAIARSGNVSQRRIHHAGLPDW